MQAKSAITAGTFVSKPTMSSMLRSFGSASEERIQQTVARLRDAQLEILASAHCTGLPATAKLRQAFPEICRPAGVGTIFEFKRD